MVLELEEKIERYARVPHYVLITGERGTGKTTIARRLHEKSTRVKREFVNLNCASLELKNCSNPNFSAMKKEHSREQPHRKRDFLR